MRTTSGAVESVVWADDKGNGTNMELTCLKMWWRMAS
jgi:hypothetical protein